MFISSAMFSAYSIRSSPTGLPFASFISMKSGSSLLISSHRVLPSFRSELKFLTLCSTTFELTHSSSAFFNASALFREIWYFRISVQSRPRTSFRSRSTMFCASMLTSLTPSAMMNLSAWFVFSSHATRIFGFLLNLKLTFCFRTASNSATITSPSSRSFSTSLTMYAPFNWTFAHFVNVFCVDPVWSVAHDGMQWFQCH